MMLVPPPPFRSPAPDSAAGCNGATRVFTIPRMTGTLPPGLCDACVHHRLVRSRRGSTFLLCGRSRIDPRYPRYPRLPVLACDGFEPGTPTVEPADPDSGTGSA